MTHPACKIHLFFKLLIVLFKMPFIFIIMVAAEQFGRINIAECEDFMKKQIGTILLVLVICAGGSGCSRQFIQNSRHWLGTWAASAQPVEAELMPPDYQTLDNTTIRQVIRVSAGGRHLRVRFSNSFADASDTLHIERAFIAESAGAGVIAADTLTPLTFGGKPSIAVPAGAVIASDVAAFHLKPNSDLAVSLYISKAPAKTTGHRSARGEAAFIQAGNAADAASLPQNTASKCWYWLCGLDVLAPSSCGAVVCLGDSLTDGKGSTEGANRRWPNYLAQRLQADSTTACIGVLNQGIGGNCLLAGGIGPTALERLDRDVLDQPAARWIIVLEGINDLGTGTADARQIIAGYEQIIERSRARGLRVYGATLLPCGRSFYDNPQLQAQRQIINHWIRTSGAFDAVIDFDAALHNPANPQLLLPEADSGDHLHLNDRGYEMMAEAVDLTLFKQ